MRLTLFGTLSGPSLVSVGRWVGLVGGGRVLGFGSGLHRWPGNDHWFCITALAGCCLLATAFVVVCCGSFLLGLLLPLGLRWLGRGLDACWCSLCWVVVLVGILLFRTIFQSAAMLFGFRSCTRTHLWRVRSLCLANMFSRFRRGRFWTLPDRWRSLTSFLDLLGIFIELF